MNIISRYVYGERRLCILLLLSALAGCGEDSADRQRHFFIAVKSDDVQTVSKLIEKGVDVNSPETPGGWSALHFAVRLCSVDLVHLLIKAGANANYSGAAPEQQGSTRINITPAVLAQVMVLMSQQYQANPLLQFSDTDINKRLHDPKMVGECEEIRKNLQ